MKVKLLYNDIVYETEKAICFLCVHKKVWVPKSCIHFECNGEMLIYRDLAIKFGVDFKYLKSNKAFKFIPSGIPEELRDD